MGTISVPRGLREAVARAERHIDGHFCWGLPHYENDVKLRFHLVELGDLELFDENEFDTDENPGWIPFASLGDDSQFLVVSVRPPYPIAMWEHEDGKVYVVWPSFDDFVGKVLDKRDKTPFEQLDATLAEVNKLVDADADADALGILDRALATLPDVDPEELEDQLARAYNLRGLALKGLGRHADAVGAFEQAASLGEDYAELNILSLLSDELPDPEALVVRALKLRDDRDLDVYAEVWLARYLAGAYLDLGRADDAEAELRKLVDAYAIANADKIAETREGIEEYIAKGGPGAAAARGFLAWLGPKRYDVSPAEAAKNRAWWQALPERMRTALLAATSREAAEVPSDEDLARCCDVRSLSLDDGVEIDDVTVFLPLHRIETLAFHGDPTSVEPLRALAALSSLHVNNDVVKDFALPSRADRDLWKAAAAGDRDGVMAALAAGASLTSRGPYGDTALRLVAATHDLELCLELVARGADPWASSHYDGSAMEIFDDEGKQALEAAAHERGIEPPGNEPWCVLGFESGQLAASFDVPEGLDVDEGASLAASWPADVRIAMQGPKRDHELVDIHKVSFHGLAVSERLAAVLRGQPGVELLPVTLVDHNGKQRAERYWVLNALAVDCLDLATCQPTYNPLDDAAILSVGAIVIDATKLGGASVFRIAGYTDPVLVTRDVADAIRGMAGVKLSPPKR